MSAPAPLRGAGRDLHAALRGMLPPQVALALRETGGAVPALFAREAQAVARAVPKRQAEFAAGRAAAREALAALGQPAAAIPMGADRAPVWPEGVIGSISHSNFYGAAALALGGGALRGIGIDLEPEADLPGDVLDLVCGEAERAWLAGLPAAQQGRAGLLIFSAKEAFFKAQYPLTGAMIGFEAAQVFVDLQSGSLSITPQEPLAGFAIGKPLPGRWAIAAGHLACAVVIGQSCAE
ncbi:MAG: 4'-phosphopantetheinyl transferase family protein [Sulfitobacter sp.]